MKSTANDRLGVNPQVSWPARHGSAPEIRRQAERLVNLARHLAPADRVLVLAVYERGMTPAEVASFVHQQARTIRSRLRRLATRVASRPFAFVIARRRSMTPRQRRVAELVFLQGASERETARQLGLTVHQVRRETAAVRVLCEQATLALGADEEECAGEEACADEMLEIAS